MQLLIDFLLLSSAFSERITKEENGKLKAICGAHFLYSGPIEKSWRGQEVERNTFPWMAALEVKASGGTYSCSAVQISSRHILTAAHCVGEVDPDLKSTCVRFMGNMTPNELANLLYARVPTERITVYVGSSCGDPEQCVEDETRFSLMKPPVIHSFDPCGKDNDLAIVELDRDVPPTVGTPVCMARANEHLADELIAIGYGDDPDKPIPDGDAFNRLQYIKIDSRDVVESNSNIIALLDNKSLCRGDSGGPLVQLKEQGKYALVGVTSSINPDCFETTPDGSRRLQHFVNIRNYIEWICTHTGQEVTEQNLT